MSATIVIWIFILHLCGAEYPIGPFASKASCDAKRAEAVKTIMGPQAFGPCEQKR